MKLRELAHSRTGDKGNTLNVSVICRDPKHYAHVCTVLTAARVKAWLADFVLGDVVRYELPNLAALNFVLNNALGGGGTSKITIDAHGKSVSSIVLDMEIDPPPAA